MQRLKQGEAAEGTPTAADDLLKTNPQRERRPTTSSTKFGISVDGVGDVMLRWRSAAGRCPATRSSATSRPGAASRSTARTVPTWRSCARIPTASRPSPGTARPRRQTRWRSTSTAGIDNAALSWKILARTFSEAGISIVDARCTSNPADDLNRFVVEVADTKTLDTLPHHQTAQHRGGLRRLPRVTPGAARVARLAPGAAGARWHASGAVDTVWSKDNVTLPRICG